MSLFLIIINKCLINAKLTFIYKINNIEYLKINHIKKHPERING